MQCKKKNYSLDIYFYFKIFYETEELKVKFTSGNTGNEASSLENGAESVTHKPSSQKGSTSGKTYDRSKEEAWGMDEV